jgi:hypothetical protein
LCIRLFDFDILKFLLMVHLLHFLLYNLSTAAVNRGCKCQLAMYLCLFLLTEFLILPSHLYSILQESRFGSLLRFMSRSWSILVFANSCDESGRERVLLIDEFSCFLACHGNSFVPFVILLHSCVVEFLAPGNIC